MEQKAQLSFSHTVDYAFVETALKARWEPFSELETEFHSFVPKTIQDFAEYRNSELDRLKALNPDSPAEDLLKLIDGQIRAHANPEYQVFRRFTDRVMAEYVTIAFLSHALSESAINAILAIGLATSGTEELFSLLERAEIKEKWIAGPKAFHPSYTLPKNTALYQTLQKLTRQRNAFVHHKIEIEMEGKVKLEGSRLDRLPLSEQLSWMRRFLSLPYDLANHAGREIPSFPGLILYDSGPIQRFPPHLLT
ncbi:MULTISPECIES: hypothetical protein [unclassified Polaromonas]|uniref:hypothetical protein n=1 Tax=unclassified Polaromonas TaxID=2638319 RepID=UPI00129DA7B3|nr:MULTISPECIES: hypothetical protein [unclassified Polaromonas]QGJ19106.1 hypothetical protein F7R28_12365 [Polaromonas sp. Pch-P]